MLLKKKTKVAELKESGDTIEERKNGNSLPMMLHNLRPKYMHNENLLKGVPISPL
ncbi:hypothetical protein DAPPUDRAFT_243110 [Daphnia pulex]|uniref:Uncharacterized protein n=1 Tax=Daphnia pulex TaxID=6669 RepID=E9GI33_DAPPU|nr:hypothetical protein DAPPUDRAFT_243110 [Daphnia pulex]|eukprot:EFX80943.1 hypothetical protein DAPPUDRAFT_243110 [Daphnia pulex]